MKPPVSHRLSSSTPDRVNIFLPAALIAVNNSVSLSPLSLPFQLLLRWCMFSLWRRHLKLDALRLPASFSPVITAGLGRPLQQRQEAVHSTGRDPSHSAPWVKQGPPRRNTRKSSGPINKVWKDTREGGGQGDSSFSPCTSVCMCVWDRRRREKRTSVER